MSSRKDGRLHPQVDFLMRPSGDGGVLPLGLRDMSDGRKRVDSLQTGGFHAIVPTGPSSTRTSISPEKCRFLIYPFNVKAWHMTFLVHGPFGLCLRAANVPLLTGRYSWRYGSVWLPRSVLFALICTEMSGACQSCVGH